MQPSEDLSLHTDEPDAPRGELAALTEAECWELLGSTAVGRVVVVEGQHAEILPVNYVVADGAVVFRTGSAGVLGRGATWGREAAFEADSIDVAARHGWSVVVRGELREAGTEAERALGDVVHPWAAGEKPVVATVRARSVSGRRLG